MVLQETESYTYKNYSFNKKELKAVMYEAFIKYGMARATCIADSLKTLGFYFATKGAISISIEDLRVPPTKKPLIKKAEKELSKSSNASIRGDITEVEKFQLVIDTWNQISEEVKEQVVSYFKQTDPLNSVYLMAFSGARGNLSQVRQLVGMRGLMADTAGQIIDIPIQHNFREGLTVTDYIISSYGARKGIVDTALKTADSGYLTRRLVDVAQDIIIRELDCLTTRGIIIKDSKEQNEIYGSFESRLIGRVLSRDIYSLTSKNLLFKSGLLLNPNNASVISSEKINEVFVRSPLTCESNRSICQYCYGWNLSQGNLVDLGEAVGIIAAQSIGEPGTQLTMRTFHTGGIFTAEPSKQIVVKFSGKIVFAPFLKYQPTRTMYGKQAFLIENFSYIELKSYDGEIIRIEVVPETILYAKNNSYVTQKQVIGELPTIKKQTVTATKKIVSTVSGELLLDNLEIQQNSKNQNVDLKNGGLIWVLRGSVYSLIANTLLLKSKGEITKKDEFLTRLNLTNYFSGLTKITQKKNNTNIDILNFIYFLKNSYLFTNNSNFILADSLKNLYNLNFFQNQTFDSDFCLAEKITDLYKTPTGGIIHYVGLKVKNSLSYKNEFEVIKTGKVLWIPEEWHFINKDKNLCLVQTGDSVTAKTELIKDSVFAQSDSLAEIVENNSIVRDIILKPGQQIKIPIKEVDNTLGNRSLVSYLEDNLITIFNTEYKLNDFFTIFNKKFYYPGEKLFDVISIEQLSYLEILKTEQGLTVLLRPVIQYTVPKPTRFTQIKDNFELSKSNLNVKTTTFLQFPDKEYIRFAEIVKLAKQRVISKQVNSEFVFNKLFKCHLAGVKSNTNPKYVFPAYIISEKVDLSLTNSETLQNQKFNLQYFIRTNQYISASSIIGILSVVSSNSTKIVDIKKSKQPTQNLLIVSENDYKTFYTELDNFSIQQNTLLQSGNLINTNIYSKDSGRLEFGTSTNLKFRLGRPYFVSGGTILNRSNGSFIQKGDDLGLLVFERNISGDIVQGLPRIEEILEARNPKDSSVLAIKNGLVINIQTDYNFLKIKETSIYIKEQNRIRIYTIQGNRKVIIGLNEIVTIGQPLNDGNINPHLLLEVLFRHYIGITSLKEAAYRSLKKIQLILLTQIQAVYSSQGVSIANKHVEIIVRQITARVQIENVGDTNLLPGEFVELSKVDFLNKTVLKNKGIPATYIPRLFGITKSSLGTDSFISAASFQETTRILTEAAIEGKVDWLRGLKENVIIGRLIPAGTGFNV